MVVYARNYNEIDKEMSRIMRNIRFRYKNEVKLQIVNAQTMTEIKLHIFHQTAPFNRFVFLVNIPKNYPLSPLCVEPIDISDEMRKQFDRDQFKFQTMKYLIEGVLEFCNMYKEKQRKRSSLSAPKKSKEKPKDVLTQQQEPVIEFTDVLNSNHSKSLTRMNLMKKYSEKIICYSKSVGYEKYRQLFDLIANGRFQSDEKRTFIKPQSVVRSFNDLYYQDFRRQFPRRRRRSRVNVASTLQSSENYINCLELNSYLDNTIEYVFLHKNVDNHQGNRDFRDLKHLLKKQYLISSIIANPEIITSRPMINNDYLESFLKISDKEIGEISYDDNVMELGENCHVYMKLIYEDLTVKITENRSIYSFNDVTTYPRFHWPLLEYQKSTLKFPSKNEEVQTIIDDSIELTSIIFLVLQSIFDLMFFSVDEVVLDFLNKSVIRYEQNNLKDFGDCHVAGQRYNVVEEDYLIIYESDMEYFKELNLSTVFSQPFESDQFKDFQINWIKFEKCQSLFQKNITYQYPDNNNPIPDNVELISSSFPLTDMYRTCLEIFRLPIIESSNLLNETDLTMEFNLNNNKERQVLKFLNIPFDRNKFEILEFFIPKINYQEIIILIKDDSLLDQKTKEDCITVHKIKSDSQLQKFFLEKYQIDNYKNMINRKIYFTSILENSFWFLENILTHLRLIKWKRNWEKSGDSIKKNLNLSEICVHEIYFYKESFEFLKNLSKSVI